MLHALLHHKLDELTPEPQRREDALTSTIFGTLVLLNAWHVLAHWLGVGSELSTSDPSNTDCWFWPRLAFAEPDVVLRLGSSLVIVEAKYGSGLTDLVPSEEENVDLCDQLVRQYKSITTHLDERVRYAETLERAIAECRLIQLFIIDARRQRRAQREWEESKGRLPPEADLRIITWQDLFRVLRDQKILQERWPRDLRSYLQLCGLDTFEGIGRNLIGPEDIIHIRLWREQEDYGRWGHCLGRPLCR